jgi:ferredoxin
MRMQMQMSYLRKVASLKIDAGKCIGCDMCTSVCPHNVIELRARKAVIRDLDACMECGACKENCPVDAVEVQQGVGCAYAIIRGMIAGTPPQCGGGSESKPCG